MGAVIWLLAAVGTLWLGLTHLVAVDSLLFVLSIILAGLFSIKAIADAVDAIGAVGEAFSARRGDFDE